MSVIRIMLSRRIRSVNEGIGTTWVPVRVLRVLIIASVIAVRVIGLALVRHGWREVKGEEGGGREKEKVGDNEVER